MEVRGTGGSQVFPSTMWVPHQAWLQVLLMLPGGAGMGSFSLVKERQERNVITNLGAPSRVRHRMSGNLGAPVGILMLCSRKRLLSRDTSSGSLKGKCQGRRLQLRGCSGREEATSWPDSYATGLDGELRGGLEHQRRPDPDPGRWVNL